jgi:hypothetical protein
MRPSSQTPWPAVLCAPPRTETSKCRLRANLIAALTSDALRQRAIRAGRRSAAAFITVRAPS